MAHNDDADMIVKTNDLDMLLEVVTMEHILETFFPAVEQVLELNGLTNADLRNIINMIHGREDFFTLERLEDQVSNLLRYRDRDVGQLIIGAFDTIKNGETPGRRQSVQYRRDRLREVFSDRIV